MCVCSIGSMIVWEACIVLRVSTEYYYYYHPLLLSQLLLLLSTTTDSAVATTITTAGATTNTTTSSTVATTTSQYGYSYYGLYSLSVRNLVYYPPVRRQKILRETLFTLFNAWFPLAHSSVSIIVRGRAVRTVCARWRSL